MRTVEAAGGIGQLDDTLLPGVGRPDKDLLQKDQGTLIRLVILDLTYKMILG